MSENILKYKSSAVGIDEAIPVSNGVIGGMIYGKPADELIKLNLDSFWSGKKTPESKNGKTHNMQRFMPFLDMHISSIFNGKPKNYARCLNLETSVASVGFDIEGRHFQRDYICTGDEGLVTGFFCTEDGSISFDAWLDGMDNLSFSVSEDVEDTLVCTGSSGGINFASALAVKADGGEVEISDNKISVRNADFVMLVFNARTDVLTGDIEETTETVTEYITEAFESDFADITRRYISWYQGIYNRVELCLEDDSKENLDILATDERIHRLRGDKLNNTECKRLINDNKLVELYFNFGRYLMITLGTADYPINPCGLWNSDSNSQYRYFLSGNLQMCYWSADVCGIEECLPPLFRFIKHLEFKGRKTAEKMYGIKEGSVCHTETDLWCDTAPQGDSPDSIWCMCLAWLAIHFFEHYEYTMDSDFLEDKYLTMRSIAMFFVKYLTEDENGRLIVSPTVSPTSAYIAEDGSEAHLCKGSAVDSQILTVLFNDIIKSCEIIGMDEEFEEVLRRLVKRLPEIEVDKYGQIKEWLNNCEEVESPEKLLYHLFALFPSDLITPAKSKKLADSSRTTLVRRLIHGGLDKGFACAWTANMWARLYDGIMVYENIKNLLTLSTAPNLINTYPDLRIDANLGAVSAIAESLLQSTNGELVLLPALPQEWSKGSVHGLRAKGGFEVSMEWADGKLTGAEIKSNAGEECRIRLIKNIPISIICKDENINPRIENGAVVFNTTEKMTYTIRC